MLGRRRRCCCCHCGPAKMADTVDASLDELVNGRADRETVGQKKGQRQWHRETNAATDRLLGHTCAAALLNPAAQWGGGLQSAQLIIYASFGNFHFLLKFSPRSLCLCVCAFVCDSFEKRRR